ncbi:MAG: polysaccharide export protein [Deltaproteobacteria bacterium]|nr:polysaccharide export protein [Deltaproteobacteria bacterium]
MLKFNILFECEGVFPFLKQSIFNEAGSVMINSARRSVLRLLLFIIFSGWLSSCASEYNVLSSVADVMQTLHSAEEYVIGHGDKLNITVWGQEGLNSEVIVQPDGKISLALVNDVQAVGLTVDALRQELEKRYRDFIFEPNVSITVREIKSLKIYVIGEVNNPGEYDLLTYTDVLQAIAKAGGFTIYARPNRIEIIRTYGGQKTKTRFNYNQVVRGKNLQQNIPLKPGDVIIVP